MQDKTAAVQVRGHSPEAQQRAENGRTALLTWCMCVALSHTQEKAKLEAQVKQYESQKQLMTKTLEKQGAIESKKRESIMVVSGPCA